MRQVNPKLKQWLADYNQTLAAFRASGLPLTVAMARESIANLTQTLVSHIPAVEYIQDELIAPELVVRIYHPEPDISLPVLVYFHGGGHLAGSIEVYDPICRKLAQYTRHIVVSVDYRLAPEHPYPAGLEDCYVTIKAIFTKLASCKLNYTAQLAIAGDSAGGAVAATVSQRVQFDDEIKINKQILIYPSLDYTLSLPSISQNKVGYLLQEDKIRWYFSQYFQNDEDRYQVSPLCGRYTSNLPKTLVITAEFCPVRDDGILYYHRLLENDVVAEHVHCNDMIHAFLNMEDLVPNECHRVYCAIADFLNS